MRRKIFEVIQSDSKDNNENRISTIYNFFMMAVIIASLVPLAFKDNETTVFILIDRISVTIFIIDYILRWITADFLLGRGKLSFVCYPFTFLALIDLLCILPSLNVLASGFRMLKVFRLFRTFRTFRVFRAFKFIRYSKNIFIMIDVIKKQKEPLLAVCALAFGYVLIAALVIFNVEADTFDTFFDAIYWAVVSLTTVGYGDIYPITLAGRIVTMLSSLVGIAIIALPSGIITAGYMEEIQNSGDQN